MRLLVAGAACALLLSAPLLRAEEGADAARKWLEKMSTAARTLNYEGTFVYLHDGQMVSMRIIHGAGPRGEQERLIVLNGVGREMEGLSYEEIAAAMDCPVGTVRSRIFRAREAIDQKLKPLLD